MKTVEGKLVVLGSQGVGKTSMIIRYVEKAFNHHPKQTVGASFFTCKLNMENARVKLQVWDTAGQERFKSMAPMYYRNANAAMLVFDLTQYDTFVAMKGWVKELQRNVEEAIVLIVIGNKSDLNKKRQVDVEEGRIYATKIGAGYYETSALEDEGIEDVFLAVGTALLRLTSSDRDFFGSIKVYESSSSGLSSTDVPLTPSLEESPQNHSIAYGIHEKSHACC